MPVAIALCRSSSASVVFPAPGGPWIRRTFPADSKKFEMRPSISSDPGRLTTGVSSCWSSSIEDRSADSFLNIKNQLSKRTALSTHKSSVTKNHLSGLDLIYPLQAASDILFLVTREESDTELRRIPSRKDPGPRCQVLCRSGMG